jgi:signal transduction histidine kinase
MNTPGEPTHPAAQILCGMHKTLAHDLPNQIVVMRSLLQLLEQDEADRLSSDGRHYVERLKQAARHAADIARFLKEMGRSGSSTGQPQTIPLKVLALELASELERRLPGRQLEGHWNWQAPAIVSDPALLPRALAELCACFLTADGTSCKLTGKSSPMGNGVELTLHLEETALPVLPVEKTEERMEMILARAWLTDCGARLRWEYSPDGAVRMIFVLPGPRG